MDTGSVSPAAAAGWHADPAAAIVTVSILRTPVVRCILHAKIRDLRCNDVVFIGDRTIDVKQVKDQGHLELIVTKSDFDATIRAAKVFNIHPDVSDGESSIVKVEDATGSLNTSGLPPQCMVLTLDSNEIVFLYLSTDSNGQHRFRHQALPMPTFDRILFQPGQYLAVDPQSRALAVAANETEIVIYAAKSSQRIQHEMTSNDPDWCPVSAQRSIQIEGVIQQMEFLIPASDDQEHVILLVLVVQGRTTKAIMIDWHYASDIHHAKIREALPLDQPSSVSGLLIPLRNAAFLLTDGHEIKRFDNILSGSIRVQAIGNTCEGHNGPEEYLDPGQSHRKPMWTNWCRPERRRDAADTLYLAREDGNVFFLYEAGNSSLMALCSAGNMECQIGTAFASVGGLGDPDILVAAGDMSNGCIQEIGSRFSPNGLPVMSRRDTMEMQFVESIPNWASVTDMVGSKLPGKSSRTRDGLFVTSGRQPSGALTELRYGLEVKLSVMLPLEGLAAAQSVWTLPRPGIGDILVVLSGIGTTSFLSLFINGDGDADVELIEPSSLDSQNGTLLAGLVADGKILHITNKTIVVSTGTDASFEDCARIEMKENDVLAADSNIGHGIVLTAQRATGASAICSYTVGSDEDGRPDGGAPRHLSSVDLASEPLALTCLAEESRTVVAITNVEGELKAFSVDRQGAFSILGTMMLPASEEGPSTCDSIAIIRPGVASARSPMLIICGMRDGSMMTVPTMFGDDAKFGTPAIHDFGQTAVKLTQPIDDRSLAYAMSGLDTCRLSWDSGDDTALKIENIWMTDEKQPALAQGEVLDCAHTPPAHLLSSPKLADSLVCVSGDELLLGQLSNKPSAVPRYVPLDGTPNRLVHLEQQRCLACASLKYGLRNFSAPPLQRRQVWPVIDFIPTKRSAVSFTHEMQPGEKVFALLEWSFRLDDDKVYSFLLVGGSYISARTGATRGRITFLQPTNKSWEVVSVKEGRQERFDDPVHALALLDPLTFVACSGCNVFVRRFNTADRKWRDICAPHELHSPGTSISIDNTSSAADNLAGALISISTNSDSAIVLRLESTSQIEDDYEYRVETHCTAPAAESSLHLLTLATPNNDTTLLTTKHGKLIGLQRPMQGAYNTSYRTLFEASLPRSLTRIKQANIRPRWKPALPPGVIVSDIIGCSADGTLTGALLIDETLWRRLSWLQRLCEWSEELSPHSFQTPAYSVGEDTVARNERGMPIGFARAAAEGRSEVVMMTERRRKEQDRHVDGDVVGRVLERGGAACLTRLVKGAAERRDAVGEWMRGHLEGELEAVEEMVGIVEVVVKGWL